MARTVSPRTRPALVEAAAELFYARGITATSVDDVAAAAELTKPTLYRHFPSKEALVTAYLDDRHEQLDRELRTRLAAAAPSERPVAVIEWLCDWITRPDFNGCAFLRGYAELQTDPKVLAKARRRKRVLRETVEEACRAAGISDPVAVSEELTLVVEGAATLAFVTGDASRVAATASRLARAVLGVPRDDTR
jgi:AcrR family transcriptional regulator